MTTPRHVLLGLAPPRTAWFRELSAWASSAVVPVEFVRCVSLAEVRDRWRRAEGHAMVIVDEATDGLAALVDEAAAWDVALIVVGAPADPATASDGTWRGLPRTFSPRLLIETLEDLDSGPDQDRRDVAARRGARPRGEVVTVVGADGAGSQAVATGLAQGLAVRDEVVLADLRRDGPLAALHDAEVRVPALPELVDACRLDATLPLRAAEFVLAVPERGYDLVLGMRRSLQWVGMRSSAVGRALDELAGFAPLIVHLADSDLEGEVETGSLDVEDRHRLARESVVRAAAVVITVAPTTAGLFAAVGLAADAVGLGVVTSRLIFAMGPSRRGGRCPGAVAAALPQLVSDALGADVAVLSQPLRLRWSGVEEAQRDVRRLPERFTTELAEEVMGVLGADRLSPS